jgi:hypothetical protein
MSVLGEKGKALPFGLMAVTATHTHRSFLRKLAAGKSDCSDEHRVGLPLKGKYFSLLSDGDGILFESFGPAVCL